MAFNLLDSFHEAEKCLDDFMQTDGLLDSLELSVQLLIRSFAKRCPVLSCGNGGSTCDAMHFAEEFTGRYRKDRTALPAMAIADPSHLTCVSNDYGFEHVFSRTVDAFGQEDGVLLAISTSGNSKNVLEAAKVARNRKMSVIGLTGKGGGLLAPLCDVCFVAPGSNADRIQEIHIKIIHTLIEGVERELFPENYLS